MILMNKLLGSDLQLEEEGHWGITLETYLLPKMSPPHPYWNEGWIAFLCHVLLSRFFPTGHELIPPKPWAKANSSSLSCFLENFWYINEKWQTIDITNIHINNCHTPCLLYHQLVHNDFIDSYNFQQLLTCNSTHLFVCYKALWGNSLTSNSDSIDLQHSMILRALMH